MGEREGGPELLQTATTAEIFLVVALEPKNKLMPLALTR